MVGLHEILLSHSDFIFRPQGEVPWMVGITVLETSPSLQPPVLFPSSQPLHVSTEPWCLTQRKVTTANIPVNRMARQLKGHRGKCAKEEAQQLKGIVADRCTGLAIAILPALVLWCAWCTVVCSRLLQSVMTINGTRVEGRGISNSLYPGCGGSCSCSCSEPQEAI